MANMKEIARMAGVSLGTVSHVLNDSAGVREPIRQRVLEAVQAAGYQPSQLARGLRRVKTNMIGMIIPDITNPFFPAVVRGAEDVAFSNGYRLILCNTDNDHSKELVHLNELRAYLPAGLIVIPSNFSDLTAQVESYRRAGTGVVCIDRLPRNWSGDSVTADNEEGAYNATRYLLRMGHTRLAVITGPLHLTNAKERLSGFKRAMREAKLHLAPEYIQETTFDKQGGNSKTHILLRLIPRATAIFAGNDQMALGLIRVLKEAGRDVPGDLSVVGFDDCPEAAYYDPPLTTVWQDFTEAGLRCLQLLVALIENSESGRSITIEPQLVVRASTRRLRK